MNDGREEVIRYRIARALEVLSEAELLADHSHWNSCVNRLYYACFYAVSALLLKHGWAPHRHSGVVSRFNQEFVRTGAVSREDARFFRELFDNRQEGDYEDFTRFEEEQVRPWIGLARAFVGRIEVLLAHQ